MRVLLVDDEAIQRKALRLELAKLDLHRCSFEFREASNGLECIQVADEFCPHLVFLDLRMPVMSGLEAAKSLSETSSARIVILTAYDDFKYAQEALKIGAVDYLLKPASQDDLREVIFKVCTQLDADEQVLREKQYLTEQLYKVKPYIELEYINEIINGTTLDIEVHQQKRELLGISGQLHMVLLLEIDEYGMLTPQLAEPKRQALKQRIADILRQEVGHVPAIIARLGANRLIAMLGFPEGVLSTDLCREWVIKLSERVRCTVNQDCGVSISLGISRSHPCPTKLTEAYNEANLALSYKFLLGTNQIVHVDDVDVTEAKSYHMSANQERDLLLAVRLGHAERAEATMRKMLEDCFATPTLDVEGLRLQSAELFILAARAASEGGASEEELTRIKQKRLNELLNSQSLEELRCALLEGIRELVSLLFGMRNVRNQRLINKAIKYIQENYHQQITLEDLARQVYLSPFYFSHIFKTEVGTSFIEYLTKVRIEEAKDKLSHTMMAVHVIALQVGYCDVNYFSRVFKKVVGLTPTQYREKRFELQ